MSVDYRTLYGFMHIPAQELTKSQIAQNVFPNFFVGVVRHEREDGGFALTAVYRDAGAGAKSVL